MDPTLIAFAMPQEAEAFLQLARRLDLDLPPAALPLQAPAARRYRSRRIWASRPPGAPAPSELRYLNISSSSAVSVSL